MTALSGDHARSEATFRSQLGGMIRDSFWADSSLDISAFYSKWLRSAGRSSFFLFRKNTTVTNVQFAELLVLLRRHIVPRDHTARERRLHLVAKSEYYRLLQGASTGDPHEDRGFKTDHVVNTYGDLLLHTAVLDAYRGTAVVLLPPSLELDIAAVCFESGYIHSCGQLIYIRNVGKASYKDLVERLDQYLRRTSSDRPLQLTVYAHEDFSAHDFRTRAKLRSGLDDVKLWVEKFYIGDTPLADALTHLEDRFQGKIRVTPAGPYKEKHRGLREEFSDLDESRSLWLIVDRGLEADGSPSHDRYYVCYEQRYVNEGQLHVFDENKPAWRSHTTLPHSLAAAGINLARDLLPAEPRVLDPFVGTGTSLLEGVKLGDVRVHGSDVEPLAPLMVRDNLSVVGLSSHALTNLTRDLRAALPDESAAVAVGTTDTEHDPYLWAVSQLDRLLEGGDVDMSAEHVAEIAEASLCRRMLFYIALRTARRHQTAFDRRSEEWSAAFGVEAQALIYELDHLASVQALPVVETRRHYQIVQGTYSHSLRSARTWLEEAGRDMASPEPKHCSVGVEMAQRLQGEWDLIIADPPYGFNTDEDALSLARLYRDFADAAVQALGDLGQVVLFLPDRSFTGREPAFFTQADVVSLQFADAAARFGYELVRVDLPRPATPNVYGPVLYWESDRALRRRLLHFVVRKRTMLTDDGTHLQEVGYDGK